MCDLHAVAFTVAVVSLTLTIRHLLRRARGVSSLRDLSSFKQSEVLSEGEGHAVLLGAFSWQPAGERALVKISAVDRASSDVAAHLETSLSSYSGAEYAYYRGSASLASALWNRPAFALEVIAPASEKQIARSRPQPGVFVTETAALYHAAVAPYIDALDPKSTSWIDKCLDLSKEAERVLFNDPAEPTGFLLNVDTKWKSHPPCTADPELRASWRGHTAVQDLYCLAICHRRDIRSLRDLTAEHLPLLRGILDQGVRTLCETYGVEPHDLRVFVHYQPQFYHFRVCAAASSFARSSPLSFALQPEPPARPARSLTLVPETFPPSPRQVHFTRLHNDLGCQAERAHLLQEVIDSLEADGACYAQKKTLYYQLKANDRLLARLRALAALLLGRAAPAGAAGCPRRSRGSFAVTAHPGLPR